MEIEESTRFQYTDGPLSPRELGVQVLKHLYLTGNVVEAKDYCQKMPQPSSEFPKVLRRLVEILRRNGLVHEMITSVEVTLKSGMKFVGSIEHLISLCSQHEQRGDIYLKMLPGVRVCGPGWTFVSDSVSWRREIFRETAVTKPLAPDVLFSCWKHRGCQDAWED